MPNTPVLMPLDNNTIKKRRWNASSGGKVAVQSIITSSAKKSCVKIISDNNGVAIISHSLHNTGKYDVSNF